MSEFEFTINTCFGFAVGEVPLPHDPEEAEEGAVEEVFTCGQCHAYAIAVQEELGGTLIGIGRTDGYGEGQRAWGHVACRVGSKVFDATGVYANTDEWRKHYGYDKGYDKDMPTDQTTRDYLLSISCPSPGTVDMDARGEDGKYLYAYYAPNLDGARVYAKHALMKRAVEGALNISKLKRG